MRDTLKSSLRNPRPPAPPPAESRPLAVSTCGTDWLDPVREVVAPRGGAEERCPQGFSRVSPAAAPAVVLCPPVAFL